MDEQQVILEARSIRYERYHACFIGEPIIDCLALDRWVADVRRFMEEHGSVLARVKPGHYRWLLAWV
jgi:hypothetical protein